MSPGDIQHLTEQHQFLLLLLAQAASIVSMLLLYRSSPHAKKNLPEDPPSPPGEPKV